MKKYTPSHHQDPILPAGMRKDEGNPCDLSKELQMSERTLIPPSADLIKELNEIASRPPFSYLYKINESDPL